MYKNSGEVEHEDLGSNLGSTILQSCDLEQIAEIFCASGITTENWGK